MSKILSPRKVEYITERRLNFDIDESGGSAFECDENGLVDASKLHECAKLNFVRNLVAALKGELYCPPYVHEFERRSISAMRIRCECRRELCMGGDTQCDCGRMYNTFGQQITRMGFQDLPGEDY
jgi:hypothetical protein